MKIIRSWPKFAKAYRTNHPLLSALPQLQQPIFVAGCQRSGGTMLTESISRHTGVFDFAWSKDAELDAAQVLAGHVDPPRPPAGQRLCLQTTYLNERYTEYFEHVDNFQLVWLLRNPHSVVFSMLYNWRRFALNEVFASCGSPLLAAEQQRRFETWGTYGVAPILRACTAYNGKIAQFHELRRRLPRERFVSVEYEHLVTDRGRVMSELWAFLGLADSVTPAEKINQRSMGKSKALSPKQHALITDLCGEPYAAARAAADLKASD